MDAFHARFTETPPQTMAESKHRILVAANEDRVTFKVAGRATFEVAPGFKEACEGLVAAGCRAFTLEVAACETMDSTFLGVIVRLARRLKEKSPAGSVTLAGMPAKVREQVSSLGVLSFFQIVDAPAGADPNFQAVNSPAVSKARLTEVSLEAHRELMSTSAENEQRFKEVAAFLTEDLQRLKERAGGT
jgi:anti-anti-sigma regulatory factor